MQTQSCRSTRLDSLAMVHRITSFVLCLSGHNIPFVNIRHLTTTNSSTHTLLSYPILSNTHTPMWHLGQPGNYSRLLSTMLQNSQSGESEQVDQKYELDAPLARYAKSPSFPVLLLFAQQERARCPWTSSCTRRVFLFGSLGGYYTLPLCDRHTPF